MTPGWVENLSDGPKIVHGPVYYINLEFETCGAGIWEKKINLGPSNIYIYDRLPAQGWISRQLKKTSIMHLKLGIWAVKSCSFWQSGH